jgi:hypothetical protein
MRWNRFRRITVRLLPVACCLAFAACQLNLTSIDEAAEVQDSSAPQENALLIENDSDLPDTYPGALFEIRLRARGGVPSLRWHLEKGALPPGIRLEEGGLLHGSPERTGEFQFTLSVTDSGKPQQAVQKQFIIRVRSAMTLVWKSPAKVNSNRIEGSVEVSNTTPDDIDLTFICLAVAGNGRATAIGYQRFNLARGMTKELPFGETLPHGGYIVHVDAVGEVASKNLIYRTKLETSGPLQVLVGP